MNAPDSKSGIVVRLSGVRIPPSPPFFYSYSRKYRLDTEENCAESPSSALTEIPEVDQDSTGRRRPIVTVFRHWASNLDPVEEVERSLLILASCPLRRNASSLRWHLGVQIHFGKTLRALGPGKSLRVTACERRSCCGNVGWPFPSLIASQIGSPSSRHRPGVRGRRTKRCRCSSARSTP